MYFCGLRVAACMYIHTVRKEMMLKELSEEDVDRASRYVTALNYNKSINAIQQGDCRAEQLVTSSSSSSISDDLQKECCLY